MPMLNAVKRRLVEHLATLVNELHVGSDGTIATSEDGGARTLARVVPRVQIIDDTSILVEGVLNASHVLQSTYELGREGRKCHICRRPSISIRCQGLYADWRERESVLPEQASFCARRQPT